MYISNDDTEIGEIGMDLENEIREAYAELDAASAEWEAAKEESDFVMEDADTLRKITGTKRRQGAGTRFNKAVRHIEMLKLIVNSKSQL